MKTNKEKYDYYLNKLYEISELFVKQEIPNLPEKVYEIVGYYNTQELIIDEAHYRFPFYKKPKPTREEVKEIKEFFENISLDSLQRENINLYYHYQMGLGKASGAIKLIDLETSNRIKLTLEELQPEIQKNKELYEPKEGFINCTYCHKVVEESKAVTSKIYFRNRNQYTGKQFVDQKYNKYCKPECAGNDQMAHEG